MKRAVLFGLSVFVISFSAFGQDDEEPSPGFNEATFKGLEMREIGPALMSGRIADIVLHPDDPSTWYVAVGSGNIWKTENGGTTWSQNADTTDRGDE